MLIRFDIFTQAASFCSQLSDEICLCNSYLDISRYFRCMTHFHQFLCAYLTLAAMTTIGNGTSFFFDSRQAQIKEQHTLLLL